MGGGGWRGASFWGLVRGWGLAPARSVGSFGCTSALCLSFYSFAGHAAQEGQVVEEEHSQLPTTHGSNSLQLAPKPPSAHRHLPPTARATTPTAWRATRRAALSASVLLRFTAKGKLRRFVHVLARAGSAQASRRSRAPHRRPIVVTLPRAMVSCELSEECILARELNIYAVRAMRGFSAACAA
jgi:hypothetical protein